MSRLTTKQRRARRRSKLHTRIHYTGCLHFHDLPLENEQISTNTWGPSMTGHTYHEVWGIITGTDIPATREYHNGYPQPCGIRATPHSKVARDLILAGYIPECLI